MCGLNGIFAYHGAANPPSEAELLATRDHMAARGPDGKGAWWSADRRIALGHRRLAIIDLNERASQPMLSDDGEFAVTFNGEIYNFPELRAELEAKGRRFRTTSDTEALLHLYALYGEDMVHHLRGMYAFAIWDGRKKGLFLARDPYGIKPLYIADDGWTFRFASQVKALLAGGKVSRDPEAAGVVGFCLFGAVPDPFTLYRDIRALPAGHSQWVDASGPREPKAFARLSSILANASNETLSVSDIQDRIRAAAADSVKAHTLADVEVGVFLSAGVDSAAVLGLMADSGQKNIRAITLGFDEFQGTEADEVPVARQIAKLYGAEHIERRVGEAEFRADLPKLLEAMDQPSIDGINTWFVAKAAREAGLRVALSGVGGDELFAGYPSFRDIPRWVRWMRAPTIVPGAGVGLRMLMEAMGVSRRAPKALGMLEFGGDYPGAYLLRRGVFLPFELKTVLDADLVQEGLRRLKPLRRLRDTVEPDPGSPLTRVCALESSNYMRHQLLRDADWAGMAHSLEIRTPLVDFHLFQTLAPLVSQLSSRIGKTALAAAPSTPLPTALVERAKTGFSVPTGAWLSHAYGGDDHLGSMGLTSRVWARRLLSMQNLAVAS